MGGTEGGGGRETDRDRATQTQTDRDRQEHHRLAYMIVQEYSIFRVVSLKSRRSEIKTIPQQHKTEMPERLGAVREAGKISATLLWLAFPATVSAGLHNGGQRVALRFTYGETG